MKPLQTDSAAKLLETRFVFDLRNGRDPRPQTVRRVLAYQTGQ